MASEADVQFRLSIWRDYNPPHPVVSCDEQAGLGVVTSEPRLQAEVYTWALRHDQFAGISDSTTRSRLRELFDDLAVSRPSAQRSLAVLGDFVATAEKALDGGETVVVQSASGDGTVRINPLLSLVLHLKWVVRCFKDRPGISVSIR